jgi:hypothetical protein
MKDKSKQFAIAQYIIHVTITYSLHVSSNKIHRINITITNFILKETVLKLCCIAMTVL